MDQTRLKFRHMQLTNQSQLLGHISMSQTEVIDISM